jgi:hypothetical protein
MKDRGKLAAWIIIVALIGLTLGLLLIRKPVSQTIVDVSWPNCRSNLPTNFREGIIGVTGGLDFHANHCLAQETTWFVGRYALYMNTGYPGASYGKKYMTLPRHCTATDKQCLAYNYGFAASEYGIRLAARGGAYSNMWWLDVETDNSWTTNTLVNRAVLEGAVAAIEQNVFLAKVGIYSTTDQWKEITGGWRNGLPAWLATGAASQQSAARACATPAFNGGPLWLSQYTTNIDGNVACSPAFSKRLSSPDSTYGSVLSVLKLKPLHF